jgi:uncharacterized membrane protein
MWKSRDDQPPDRELYRFWRNFENLAQFMEHLESVAVREEGISHWIAKVQPARVRMGRAHHQRG